MCKRLLWVKHLYSGAEDGGQVGWQKPCLFFNLYVNPYLFFQILTGPVLMTHHSGSVSNLSALFINVIMFWLDWSNVNILE